MDDAGGDCSGNGERGRRVLVLLHEPGNSPAVLGRQLRERGFTLTEHLIVADLARPHEVAPFPDIDGFDLVVAMGSIRSVYDTATVGAWIDLELDLLRRAHEGGRPVLGICFGGQALATALGGRVERAPAGEIGWYEVDGPGNPLGPGPWFEWHGDRFEVPPGAEVLARTPLCPQLYRIGHSVGTQFHPEVDLAHVSAWLDECDDAELDGLGVDRDRLLAETARHDRANAERCGQLLDWFLRGAGLA